MAIKKVGRGLIIVGVLGIVSSVLAALLLSERTTAQSIQILGIEISAVIILLGLLLKQAEITNDIELRKQVLNVIDQILNFPIIIWVLTGFLLVYFLLFISPIFLNPDLAMNYLAGYVPNINPIGNDLIVMVDRVKEWVTTSQSPYALQFYPPLTYIVFTPLLLFKDYATLYKFFTLFTFFNYCILTLLLPLKVIDRKYYSLALLLFITGLFSYGFQFELERGQYNVFTFLLCLSSIYIFHYHRKYRLLAYLLFSLSIQLKLYPAIFIVMFVDDWKDWKSILLRFAALGTFNLMLFFAMGYQIFWDFIRSVTTQIVNPTWFGVWNHSISAFVSSVKADGLGLVSMETLRLIRHNAGWLEAFLLLAFIILFISSIIISRLRKEPGVDPYLLLACTIGALVLPISYDYKLSILTTPMLLFLSGIPEMNNRWHKLVLILSILGISVAYASTLIPYKYRPYFLDNIFPSLFFILISATILNFIRYISGKVTPVTN
ncbi:MAG: DUF2029 domain-containing protein [Chloroflexi bacterium]|nr:MAG: DUF2029 domain-containing protein [Chloroflexota bacterium]